VETQSSMSIQHPLLILLVAFSIVLTSCASAPVQSAGDAGLEASLFAKDKARFILYFAASDCTSMNNQDSVCVAAGHALNEWSSSRNVIMERLDDLDDGQVLSAVLDNARKAAQPPLAVVLRYRPSVVASVTGQHYAAGSVGFKASIFVYDIASGALQKQATLGRVYVVELHDDIVPYARATIRDVLANIDPGYKFPSPLPKPSHPEATRTGPVF